MERHVMRGYAHLPVRGHERSRTSRRRPGRWLPEDRFERENAIAALWSMVGTLLALFLAPGLNGFIAGWMGFGALRDSRLTLRVALLALGLAVPGLWLILGPLGLPILGLYPGVGTGKAVLLSVGGLMLGVGVRSLLSWAAHGLRHRSRA
ncbi:hypothetical protein JY651_38275 [Pyxidicoccus parkwayensis]|uniref:Uncharacterized protein n=1 Tax=Pyxidicoccus parkwayensis TaxID=2813578 RepID=A0ABX7NU60_9BACT|nr:hypothetical protein [Pyxidicoccus parkwaysis]QSQ21007.1 hypothetical protein JY651_38275 [Pyxidicoccus parkwaysis]